MQKNEDIRDAVEELESVSQDAQTRIRAELRLKAIRDEKAERAFAIEKGLEEGRQRGLEEGRAQGIAEGKAEGMAQGIAEGMAQGMAQGRAEGVTQGKEEIVKNMLNEGLDINLIARVSKLSIPEIEKIKK